MKSKTLFHLTFLLLSFLFLTGCHDDPVNPPSPEFSFQTDYVNVGYEGGDFSVSYTLTNPIEGAELNLESDVDWITDFNYETSGRIVFQIYSNTETLPREAVLKVTYPNLENRPSFTVHQEPAPEIENPKPALTLDKHDIQAPAEGGEFTVKYTVTNPIEGKSIELKTSADWISNLSSSSESISFLIAVNEEEVVRNSEIIVSYQGSEENAVIQVSQDAALPADPTIILDKCGLALFDNAVLDNYYIVLTDTQTEMREDGCYPIGKGHTLYLDFYTESVSSKDNMILSEGSYKLKKNSEAGSCNSDYSFLFKSTADGNLEQILFMAGTVDVKRVGDSYTIEAQLYDEKNQEHKFCYSGSLDFQFAGKEDDPVIDHDMDIQFTEVLGSHFKDPLSTTSDVVILKFADVMLDEDGKLLSPGTLLTLQLNSEVVPDPQFPILFPGTYKVSDTYSIYTLNKGVDNGYYIDGSFCADVDDSGLIRYGLLSGGSIEIVENGLAGYIVTFNLETAEGHHITGSYQGAIDLAADPNGEIPDDDDISDLKSDYDVDLAQAGEAKAVYLGDYYFVGSDVWKITLAEENGDAMIFEVFAPASDGSALPAGKYSPTNMYEELTFMPGTEGFDGVTEGTWLLSSNNGNLTGVAPAMDGWLEVVRNGVEYTFSFAFSDGASTVHYFRGSWSGTMTIDNQGF